MITVEISFEGSEDDGTLRACIYNPVVLPAGLSHQIKRYGLTGPSIRKPQLSGRINGTRKALTELIQTYGGTLKVVEHSEPAETDRTPQRPSAINPARTGSSDTRRL